MYVGLGLDSVVLTPSDDKTSYFVRGWNAALGAEHSNLLQMLTRCGVELNLSKDQITTAVGQSFDEYCPFGTDSTVFYD